MGFSRSEAVECLGSGCARAVLVRNKKPSFHVRAQGLSFPRPRREVAAPAWLSLSARGRLDTMSRSTSGMISSKCWSQRRFGFRTDASTGLCWIAHILLWQICRTGHIQNMAKCCCIGGCWLNCSLEEGAWTPGPRRFASRFWGVFHRMPVVDLFKASLVQHTSKCQRCFRNHSPANTTCHASYV